MKHTQDYIRYTARPIDPSYLIANYITCNKFFDGHGCYLAIIIKLIEHRFVLEVVKDPKWREAMTKDLEALDLNHTWSIEDLPLGCKPINCKWVYHVKYNSDGTVERECLFINISRQANRRIRL